MVSTCIHHPLEEALAGVLLGTAAGDLVGLPFENLSAPQVGKLLRGPLEPSLVLGRGMVSDDTEHALMVADALLASGGQPEAFSRALSRYLRRWLLTMPPGVGWASLRSALKLCIGIPPQKSGVFSAGNAPAMRVAVLGVLYGDQPDELVSLVAAATVISHTDPMALEGALAVAWAAHCAARTAGQPVQEKWADFQTGFRPLSAGGSLQRAFALIDQAVKADWPVSVFAKELGCKRGVSGFILQTVPVALYAWLRHGDDFRLAVTEVVRCGGDTDTVGAITGALVGAGLGAGAIPATWMERHLEFLGIFGALRTRARQLAQPMDKPARPLPRPWLAWRRVPLQLGRNIVMLLIILYAWARRTLRTLLP